jgi:hypothetical protein
MLLQIMNEPTSFITQEQCDAQAERIAAVFRERKKIGDQRRRRELEYQRRNNDRALSHYYKGRGEVSQQPERRNELSGAGLANGESVVLKTSTLYMAR